MRTREEIMGELREVPESTSIQEFKVRRDNLMMKQQLEVLLDIRDLLARMDNRPAVKHPDSPPPPEVKR